ncbi:MAG: BACON domain-containing protein [Vicinamibacteria bacterium]|nr:BACON domain-containing protein [Vicinamibacteria bacterium]
MGTRLLNGGALVAAMFVAGAGCDGHRSPNEPTPVCSFAVSPANQVFGGDGGAASVTVAAPAACAWSATASAGWVTITAGGTGTGPGTVAYSVAANPSMESRNGTLTIGGQSHAVTQQGRAVAVCTYAISPGSAQFGKDAGTGTFAVSAPGDCAWAATPSAPWVVVTSGNQGSGNGSVSYTVARNLDLADRTATITAADRVFTVRQSGDLGRCDYAVAPVELTPCMPKGSLTASMTSTSNCPWSVTENASWLAVSSGPSGKGSGVITITFTDNYDAPREGTIMVRWPTPTAGQNIHVAQAGCLYAVSRSAISVAAGGGTASFDVIQQSVPYTCGGPLQDRCLWTAKSDVPWIVITSSMPRSGDDPVSFAVAANAGAASRVGHITVRNKVVTVTQAGQ